MSPQLIEPPPTSMAPMLDDYRVDAPAEVQAYLQQLVRQEVPVTLAAPDGVSLVAGLWTLDAERELLVLTVPAGDARVGHVVEGGEAVAVAYLDNVKLQFELEGLMLVHGHEASVLHARYPDTLLRFQRRGGYRVRPLGRQAPIVAIGRPDEPQALLRLRVLDLSHGGLALLLPEGVEGYGVGTAVSAASLELDAGRRIQIALRVVHVSPLREPGQGQRLGCEIEGLSGLAARTLQRYIDETQKRARLMAV